jgi:hypothetical protein
MEFQLTLLESLPEPIEKQSPKQAGQHTDRQKEALATSHPAATIWRQSAVGDHTVQMGMVQQVLSPGVQDG